MGKYTSVASHLAPKPEESGYQEQVNTVKRALIATPQTEADLAKNIVAIRQEKAALKEQLADVQLRLTAAEQLLCDRFDDQGMTQLKLESGETVTTQIKPYARVQDRMKFRQWCITNGLEESLTLPWQTTNQLVSDRLVDGLPEPDGIETYKQTTVVLRKGRA